MQATEQQGNPVKHARLKDIAGLTDIGLKRGNNEDAIAWDAALGLALVSDGLGGCNGGEVASLTAVRSIKNDMQAAMRANGAGAKLRTDDDLVVLVRELIRRANQKILAMAARDPSLQGMGATLAIALLTGDRIAIANVGDSRVYRMRGGNLAQLTRDHLIVNEMIERGYLSAEQAHATQLHNILTRSLGMEGPLEVDIALHPVESGDLYLLCSDGLTGAVSDDELAVHLRDPQAGLRELVHGAVLLANRNGGHDNISAVLMSIA